MWLGAGMNSPGNPSTVVYPLYSFISDTVVCTVCTRVITSKIYIYIFIFLGTMYNFIVHKYRAVVFKV